jgi:hypothetical protein
MRKCSRPANIEISNTGYGESNVTKLSQIVFDVKSSVINVMATQSSRHQKQPAQAAHEHSSLNHLHWRKVIHLHPLLLPYIKSPLTRSSKMIKSTATSNTSAHRHPFNYPASSIKSSGPALCCKHARPPPPFATL